MRLVYPSYIKGVSEGFVGDANDDVGDFSLELAVYGSAESDSVPDAELAGVALVFCHHTIGDGAECFAIFSVGTGPDIAGETEDGSSSGL